MCLDICRLHTHWLGYISWCSAPVLVRKLIGHLSIHAPCNWNDHLHNLHTENDTLVGSCPIERAVDRCSLAQRRGCVYSSGNADKKAGIESREEKCRADVPVNIVISHSPAARFTHSLTHLGMYVLSIDNAPCTSSASASGLSALSPASNIIMRKASGVNVQCIFPANTTLLPASACSWRC